MDSIFKIKKEQMQGKVAVTVFGISGFLDSESEETLLAAAQDAYNEGARYLLLDLQEVEMLTSAGMRALYKVYKIYTPENQQFVIPYVKLCSAPTQVYNVLGITGLLHNIPMYETRLTALESFGW
jgi:anti-anti-sigma factor